MKLLFFTLGLLLGFLSINAQSWRGINIGDTTYYTVSDQGNDTTWRGYLRCILVDSSAQLGIDSIHYFHPSAQQVNGMMCFDTLAMSWLGPYFITLTNGDEYYFNKANDTLLFKTQSQLGDNWLLLKDTTNIEFVATVTSVSTLTIDGVLDSVKEISIQAWQGTNPANHYFNNKKIRLSKAHGFQSLLQFEYFPYDTSWYYYNPGYIHYSLSLNHERLDASIKNTNFNHIDFGTQYVPGNEWITKGGLGWGNFESLYGPCSGTNTTTHDSVISVLPLSATQLQVTLQRHQFIQSVSTVPVGSTYTLSVTNSVNTQTLIDTIEQNTAPNYIKPYYCMDYFTIDSLTNNSYYDKPYFIDTICDFPLLSVDYVSHKPIGYNAGCYGYGISVSGGAAYRSQQIGGLNLGSGYSKQYNIMWQLAINSYSKTLYFKIGSCTYSNKINVLALNNSHIQDLNSFINIYPNPAHDNVTIALSKPALLRKLILSDMNGTQVQQVEAFNNSLVHQFLLRPLPKGIYFLRLYFDDGVYVKKMLID